MSITGLEMAGADSAHRSAPGQQPWGRLDTSRSRAAHGYAVPGLLPDRVPGTPIVGQNPCCPPCSAHPPPWCCRPGRRAGPSLLSRGLGLSQRGSPRPRVLLAQGTGGKRAEGNQPTAGGNLLTGRYGEERSGRRKGQSREDVRAVARRSCPGGCQSCPVPPRPGPSLTGLLSSPTVCER